MAPKKVTNKRPASDSVEKLQKKIHTLGDRVRSHATSSKQQSAKQPMVVIPPKTMQFVEPEIPAPPPIVSADLADNPYAQEIFMCKTNVRDITMKYMEHKGHSLNEKDSRLYRSKLYRMYASDPKARIRDPLYQVRFESEYYEYRFFLALNKPLHSEEQYQEYMDQLKAAGVSECWVSMRHHNRLLMYEDKIIQKLKKNFNHWSWKLEKLDFYLKDMIAKHPLAAAPQKDKTLEKFTSEDDQLLENLLKYSNVRLRLSDAQIRAHFLLIKQDLLAPVKIAFKWLRFDDDELNKRFKLETKQTGVTAEVEVVEAPAPLQESVEFSSRPSSTVSSGDSEMAHMRSEMAMTQPQEDLLPMEVSRFADTNELVSVLGPVAEPPLPEMVEPQVEPMVTDQHNQELSPMITPAQAEVVEVSDSPVKDGDEVEIKQEFIFTLEYLKKFTNIEQVVIEQIKQQSPRKAKSYMRKLNLFVEKYYELKKEKFLQNVLPKELRMLTRKERRERQEKAADVSDANRSDASSVVASTIPDPEPPKQTQQISPHTETPSVPRVPRKSKLIMYTEDDEEVPPNQVSDQPSNQEPPVAPDTLSMPHSDEFLPSVFSTQLPADDGVLSRPRQDTPYQSPIRPVVPPPQCASASSTRVPTPAFAADSPNTTVIANKNEKPPSTTPSIKRELNSTSYEGEVEFVELRDSPIVINESMDTNSQNIPELLGRQPSCLVALPDNLRGMVNTLFKENQDPTLSQGSGTSSGSGGNNRSKLSQDVVGASAPSMGFHPTEAAPSTNSEKSTQLRSPPL